MLQSTVMILTVPFVPASQRRRRRISEEVPISFNLLSNFQLPRSGFAQATVKVRLEKFFQRSRMLRAA